MTTNPSSADSDTASDRSKSDRVYKILRRRIRELELPPGSRLNKNAIAVECGVSRAPVSEAIARLAEEGLIDVYPQSGSFVSPIRPRDIRESLLIRTGLEVEAIRRVTQMRDDALLAQLDNNLKEQAAALRENDMVLLDDLDEAFHGMIFAAIDSPRAQRLLDSMRALLDRPRFHALPEDDRPKETLAEHQRIVDAIRSGDPEFAGAAMRAHLNMVARAIEPELAPIEQGNEH